MCPSPMRVAYLALDVNLKDASGDAIHVKEATRALASAGAEIHLVVPAIERRPQSDPGLEKGGVRIHSIAATGNVQAALACRKLAAKARAELVYERRYSPKIGAAVSRATGLPLVVEVNGLLDVEAEILGKAKRRGKVTAAVKSRLRRSFYARASRVVTVTPGLAKALQLRYGLPPEKVVVVPNGADTDLLRPQDAAAAKGALGIPADRPTVGFVGTLYPWHGLQYLVGAAPPLVGLHPEILFLVVGDGPIRGELEAHVKAAGMVRNFRFTGRVDHEAVPGFVNASDVCVSLIDAERYREKYGFSPLKLYEYLACGRPVVATRTAGFDILEEFLCGLLVNPRDPLEVSSAILSLLHNPGRRTEMGGRARKVAEERYSWRSVAERLLEVMREAAG